MQKYTSLAYWLPKIPLLSLISIFLLPLILMKVNADVGLYFIALYIAYWSVKVFQSYFYVLRSYYRLLMTEKIDFSRHTLLKTASAKDLHHIVIVPIYTEPYDVIEDNIESLLRVEYPYRNQITILLATEARAPHGADHAKKIIEKYTNSDIEIVNIVHPADLPDE